MTAQSRSGPEPKQNGTDAHEVADALLALSREILTFSTKPQLPQLGQMILRRGSLLTELAQYNPELLPDESRARLLEKLAVCRKLDETIELNLKAQRADMEEHLRGMKTARALLDKYRVGGSDPGGTRQEDV